MKQLMAITGLAAVLAFPAANAAVSDEDFAAVKQMLEDALNRIDELEGAKSVGPATPAETAKQVEANTAAIKSMSWAERIKMKGDFRYRYQNDDKDTSSDDRNRQRIRARAAILADVTDTVEVGLGVATGGDDPVSTNQTLGDGGSSKGIQLDQAYFKWNAAKGTDVLGGKFKRNIAVVGKSGLQYDSDWRPEGLGLSYDEGMFFANALYNWLEADSNKNDEAYWILQGGLQGKTDAVKWKAGIGYSDLGAKGRGAFYDPDGDCVMADGCYGNELDASDNYLYDFEVYNLFGSATVDVADMPLTLFGDWIKNNAADDHDQGFLVGAQLGKASKQGTWQTKLYYKELEANATLGLLSNSDFGGGGTNGEGYVFAAKYATTDSTTVGFTYYDVEKDPDEIFGSSFDYKTFQLDFAFKYK